MSTSFVPRPMVRAEGRGCLGSVVVTIAAFAVCAGLLAGAGLAGRLAPEPYRPLAVAGGLLVGMLAFVVGVFSISRRRAAKWDDAFAPLGLQGSPYMMTLRHWSGAWEGRPVDATLHKGPLLEIFLASRTNTRAAIGKRSGLGLALGKLIGAHELPLHDPAYANFTASADDHAWGTAFFSDPRVRDRVLRLMTDPEEREMRSLMIEPARLRYRRHFVSPGRMTAAENGQTLEDLAAVALVAEGGSPRAGAAALPIPVTPATRPRSGLRLVVIILVALVLVSLVCVVLPAAIMVLTVERSRPVPGVSAPPSSSMPGPAPATQWPEPRGKQGKRRRW